MVAVAEAALEHSSFSLAEHRQVLANIEINRTCPFSKVCDSCILKALESDGPDLSAQEIRSAVREFLSFGETVRHFAVTGMEPLATPDIFFDEVLAPYHAAKPANRPGTIGMITSSAGLKALIPRFAELPLHWTAVSIDTKQSGLRRTISCETALTTALQLRESGGTKLLGINTLLTNDNWLGVIDIGKQVLDAKMDQWALSPLLIPQKGKMQPLMSPHDVGKLIDTVTQRFGGAGMAIVFELDYEMLAQIVGLKAIPQEWTDRWRIEHRIPGTSVRIMAGNPNEAYFLRLRVGGQLLSKRAFRLVSPGHAGYGRYEPGKIRWLLEHFELQRSMSTLNLSESNQTVSSVCREVYA